MDSGTGAHLRAVALSGSSAWAVGDAGTLLRSTDGGASWTSVATGATGTLRAVRFRDASAGWAVGDGGTVLYSANGGASWTLLNTGNGQNLSDLSVTGAEAAWAVGGNGPRRCGWRRARTGLHSSGSRPGWGRRSCHVLRRMHLESNPSVLRRIRVVVQPRNLQPGHGNAACIDLARW